MASAAEFQSPEVLLPSLNAKCLRLLAVADAMFEEHEHRRHVESLKAVLRKLQIVELLHGDQYVVAVAGLQGSGKSTLLKQLFNIPVGLFFPENLGRGERIPILVSQTERTDASCWVKRFVRSASEPGTWATTEEPLSPDDFRDRSRCPDEDDIVLRLALPRRDGLPPWLSFLLLPGFEQREDDKWREWQEVMKASLACAASCVFVFDRTRFGDERNRVLLESIQRDFRHAAPIFVLAKSDEEKDHNRELRSKIIADFAVSEPGRVICSGTTTELQQAWIPVFISALQTYVGTPAEFRTAQLMVVKRLVAEEQGICAALSGALVPLRRGLLSEKDRGKDILEEYDKAAKQITTTFRKTCERLLGLRYEAARRQLDLQIRATGLGGRIWDGWRDFWGGPAAAAEFSAKVMGLWQSACDYGEDDEMVLTLNAVVDQHVFKASGLLPTGMASAGKEADMRTASLVVYRRDGLSEVTSANEESGIWRDPTALKGIAFLLYPKCDSLDTLPPTEVLKHARLLPALALEYARLKAILPPSQGMEKGGVTAIDVSPVLAQVGKDVEGNQQMVRNVLGGIALLMGLSDASDGRIDSIPALIDSLAKMLGVSVATATAIAGGASAILSAGFAVGSLASHANRHALKKDDFARQVFAHMREVILAARVERVEDLMEQLRGILEERLCDRYCVNKEQGRVQRIEHGLAQLRSGCRDMIEAINSHPARVSR